MIPMDISLKRVVNKSFSPILITRGVLITYYLYRGDITIYW